ncbi:MAG: matrixin family metalloprotease [Flavobacteriales bacterium]|nr:matrixin family metalloprotease [Flavobacteriales bacterium]
MTWQLSAFVVIMVLVSACRHQPPVVVIQPYTGIDQTTCDTVQKVIEEVYQFNVSVLPTRDLPEKAFTNVKSPRYRASILLKDLKEHLPASADHILGLTTKDISITKLDASGNVKKPEYKYEDWGVFGLGSRPGPSCVVSLFRLKSDDQGKFYERLKKISIHEIGHNLGLKHCTSPGCVMQDAAETIRTIDAVNLELCPECRRQIDG